MSLSNNTTNGLINASQMAELQDTARNIEPAVRFVPIRGLRRVIRWSRPWDEFASRVPHEMFWPISRAELSRILPLSELNIAADDPSTQFLLLPEIDEYSPIQNLDDLWRCLFHAKADAAIDERLKNADAAVHFIDRRHAFGPTLWHEIRNVLESVHRITLADPDAVVYREFTSFLFELHFFHPDQVHEYFPGLLEPARYLTQLLQEYPATQWVEETKPHGVSHLPIPSHTSIHVTETMTSKRTYQSLGNDVKAALELAKKQPDAVNEPLEALCDRLASVLNLEPNQREQWATCLRMVVAGVKEEGWTTERRLLYDLQSACLASEQQLFAADLVEPVITLGQQPIKRLLTKPKWLLVGRHLKSASRRAASLATIPPFDALENLIHEALAVIERVAREDLRPVITEALNEVGLVPENALENISQQKAVEELLDSAWERGFLRIGDLRDTLARNRVKLRDLSGPVEFITGDALIRANRLLAVRLDGVYHRGEVYMRVLQRICSLFFGTPIGRLFSLYIALPFGGAFVFLEAIHHMVEAATGLSHWLSGWNSTVKGFSLIAGAVAHSAFENHHSGEGIGWIPLIIVGCILFLLIHWSRFRTVVRQYVWFALFKVPLAIIHSPVIRLVLNNSVTRFYRRNLFLPSVTGTISGIIAWLIGYRSQHALIFGFGVALTTIILVRTTLGRGIEDRFNDAISRAWRVLSVNFLLGVLTFVLRIFSFLLESIDRGIYAVDEWLRFRQGQSTIVFMGKLLLGLAWFVFTYVFRFAWNLLVEPQINPIKHFPVVTVSHKMLLPLIPSLAKQFAMGEKTMGLIVSGIPGIFGFLVWELKENWKLYRANASKSLGPVIVGSHGEKMRALLRPGFHSGVVPKTWGKLRKALAEGQHGRAAKHHHQLEHIAESLHRLVEREFASVLRISNRWAGYPFSTEVPILATNRIRFPIRFEQTTLTVYISIEERGGWLIASLEETESLQSLSPEQRNAFSDALTGLYKLIGVHAIREQTIAIFGEAAGNFDATPDGLLIPHADGSMEFFDYSDGPEVFRYDRRLEGIPVVFSEFELEWSRWLANWEADRTGEPIKPLLPEWKLMASVS